MSEPSEDLSWDVTIALRDVAGEMAQHTMSSSTPDQEQLRRWLLWLGNAAKAYRQLELACEDIVELGASDEHLQAMTQALATAQGQATYCYPQGSLVKRLLGPMTYLEARSRSPATVSAADLDVIRISGADPLGSLT